VGLYHFPRNHLDKIPSAAKAVGWAIQSDGKGRHFAGRELPSHRNLFSAKHLFANKRTGWQQADRVALCPTREYVYL